MQPLTTIPPTSACFGQDKIRNKKTSEKNRTQLEEKPVCAPCTEAKAVAMALSILEDAVMVGPTIRVAMEHTSISITHMTHSQNNMAHPAVYAVVLIILLRIVIRENMI